MSIQDEVQLPSQPASGGVTTIPLGGNGFLSPHSAQTIKIAQASDASGGYNRVYVRFDPRYVQLLAILEMAIDGASANVNIDVSLVNSLTHRAGIRIAGLYLPVSGQGADIRHAWTPPPIFSVAGNDVVTQPPYVRVTIPNTDGETLTLYLTVFNFDRQAREVVPIESMSRVLVRSPAVT